MDSDVGDAEDERFRGHVYYKPVKEVEEEYGLTDVAGTERDDFLRVGYSGKDSGSSKNRLYPKQDKARSDNSNFVRVLEICNLKDSYEDKENPESCTKVASKSTCSVKARSHTSLCT